MSPKQKFHQNWNVPKTKILPKKNLGLSFYFVRTIRVWHWLPWPCLCRFSLITHFLVKICPAFRIQSVKWTCHIGLSIQQETKKQGQNDCYEKGTDLTFNVCWEDSEFIPYQFIFKLLSAGEILNSFLLNGI